MALDYQQTDNSPSLGDNIGCSGATISGTTTPQSCLASSGGTAGTTEETITIDAKDTGEAGYMVEIDPGADVAAGTHVAKINPTTTNADFQLDEVHVCWWNGSTYSSLGSATSLALAMTAIRTVNITGCSASPTYSSGDRLYYVFVFSTGGSHGGLNLGVTPNQIMQTPGGTIEKTLTPATETDSAQALSVVKVLTLTPATETDTAQPLSATKIVTLTPATETDTAQPLSAVKILTITPATETDVAQPLSAAKVITLTPATETDVAQPLSATKIVTLTPATETDVAQPLSGGIVPDATPVVPNRAAGGIGVSPGLSPIGYHRLGSSAPRTRSRSYYWTFSRLGILRYVAPSGLITRTLTPATETDTAQPLSVVKILTLTPATETDTAQPLSASKVITLTPATETDVAQPLSATKIVTLTPATETDTAQPLSAAKVLTLTPATETDAAQPLNILKVVTLTPATETDVAQPLSYEIVGGPIERTLTPATETDVAQPLSYLKVVTLTPAVETDAAQPLSFLKTVNLTPATETDTAQPLTILKPLTLTPATETDVAQPLSYTIVTEEEPPMPPIVNGGFFDTPASKVLDFLTGKSSFTAPTNLYLALCTSAPDDATFNSGMEASGGSYARASLAVASFNAAANRRITYGAAITFPTATADWGKITHWVLTADATSYLAAYRLAWGEVDQARYVRNGDQFSLVAGAIGINFDSFGDSSSSPSEPVNRGITDYAAHAMLEHITGKTTWSPLPDSYIMLYDASPGDEGYLGTPMMAARTEITAAQWDAAASRATRVNVNKLLTIGSEGYVGWVTIWDSLTNGEMIFWAELDAPRWMTTSDVLTISADTLVVTLNSNP